MIEARPSPGLRLLCFSSLFFFYSFISSSSCHSSNDDGKALIKLREGVVSDPYGAFTGWRDDDGEADGHCSWFGVECSPEGKVVILDLRDLCLGGTLAPEIGDLVHLKSILLRNNCFTGNIPNAIGELKELEVLDLGYNNFIGLLPPSLGINFSLTTLLLDNNELLGSLTPEINMLKLLSEHQVDDLHLSNSAKGLSCVERSATWNAALKENAVPKRKLQAEAERSQIQTNRTSTFFRDQSSPPPPLFTEPGIFPPPPPAVTPTTEAPVPAPVSPSNASSPSPDSSSLNGSSPSPSLFPTNIPRSSKNHTALIAGVVGSTCFLVISAIVIYFCAINNASIKPWATGISGQLQKALITGVPKLNRSELQASCEDFSNVIGVSAIGTLYKGTLSSGVEIAVASVGITSAKDWSSRLENQFRKKVETLSKVNHKNFVNLIGYCEEDEPFTRMLVFEYAPNGTLFEHLHIKESEHLDWQIRLRIAMGMAYCLEHMHQMNPQVVHHNLTSSSVYLTEDYAAKISDLSFSRDTIPTDIESSKEYLFEEQLPRPESNVYGFGVLLVEMITGRLPYTLHTDSLDDWASDYLIGDQPLKQMVDPTLTFFDEEKLDRICELIRSCVHSDPRRRPTMHDVAARLRDVTGLTPEAAIPKLSPLWWAELEVMSPDVN